MSSSEGLYRFATCLKRLEAVASRLEDVAAAQYTSESASSNVAAGSPTMPLPPPPPPPPPPPLPSASVNATSTLSPIPTSVVVFEESVVAAKITPWVELSKSLDVPLITEIATLISKEYEELRNFLVVVGSCQEPSQQELQDLLLPLQKAIEAFSKAKDSNRRDRASFGHLQFASEVAVAVGWVVNNNPSQFIKDVKESSEYYGNRVLKDYKEKDPRHVEWCRGLNGILDSVRDYSTGHPLKWNASGPTVQEFRAAAASSAAPPTDGVAAVFAELNRGEEITKGLRKVDKSEMTHKNPSLRAGNTVPAGLSSSVAGKKPIRPTKPAALAGKKPPKFALEGNKWMIENQENANPIKVEQTSLNQSVNLYNCSNTTVVIEGKINALNLIRCTKTAVLINSVVASVSITASPSFTIQVTGTVPMIQVDTTDSGQIYLSKESSAAEITTAKCSAINVSLPVEGEEEGVFDEHPVPEMLKTVVKDGKLVTTVVEHIG